MTELKERNEKIYDMRKKGYTFAEISKHFKISKERTRQIISIMKRMENRNRRCPDFVELPNRVRNALELSGIFTKEQLINLLESEVGVKIYWGIGEKGVEELQNFVGFKISKKDIYLKKSK